MGKGGGCLQEKKIEVEVEVLSTTIGGQALPRFNPAAGPVVSCNLSSSHVISQQSPASAKWMYLEGPFERPDPPPEKYKKMD